MSVKQYTDEIIRFGRDILLSDGLQREKQFMQHGSCSVFRHSVTVAYLCLRLADRYRLRVDRRALVRGALLHDYFLYDWHEPLLRNKIHGFTHPSTALRNAKRDFHLSKKEQNMIKRHMFPLTPLPPSSPEGLLLCVADKIAAAHETIGGMKQKFRKRGSSS